jgi:hypothetical protein
LFRPEAFARSVIRKQLQRYRYQGHYQLLSDKYLFDQYAQPTKVPEVIVSRYGLFLIEYCDAKHEIYGSDCTNRWYSYHKDVFHPFVNPHHQLHQLKRGVSIWYDVPTHAIYTVIIFTKNVTFNHKGLKRTARPGQILEILDNFPDYKLEPEKQRNIYQEIESSAQHITTEPKRCIIETEIIEAVPP